MRISDWSSDVCSSDLHRRWRAFIDVRGPHVEWHGTDLERQARDHEDDAEQQADIDLARHRRGDAREIGGARETIEQRDAEEQDARGERPEDEIFESRLDRKSDV